MEDAQDSGPDANAEAGPAKPKRKQQVFTLLVEVGRVRPDAIGMAIDGRRDKCSNERKPDLGIGIEELEKWRLRR